MLWVTSLKTTLLKAKNWLIPQQKNLNPKVHDHDLVPHSANWLLHRKDLFDKLANQPENPRFDRKRQIKVICYKIEEFVLLPNDSEDPRNKSIRDFVTDAIAMLNSSRRRGKHSAIVFGIMDNWEPYPNGIIGHCTRDPLPEAYPSIDDLQAWTNNPKLLGNLQSEIIHRDFIAQIERYIEPLPDFDWEFGWYPHEKGHTFIGFLLFHPSDSDPYRVKKQWKKGDRIWLTKVGLHAGQSWMRGADENRRYEVDDIAHLVTHRDVPFVSIDRWENYLSHLIMTLRSRMNNETQKTGYQKLRAQDFFSQEHVDLVDAIREFMSRDDLADNVLFVLGEGGTGKSTTLQEIVSTYAEKARDELPDQGAKYVFDQPNGPIPIYVEIGDYLPSRGLNIDEFIVSKMRGIDLDGDSVGSLFSDPLLDFLVVLDSVDEVASQDLESAVNGVLEFTDLHKTTKFVIASRPNTFRPKSLEGRRVLAVSPLSHEQVLQSIRRRLPKQQQADLEQLLEDEPELLELMSNLRFLTACLNSCGLEPVTFGNVLRSTLLHFIEHEKAQLYPDKATVYEVELNDFAGRFLLHDSVPTSDAESLLQFHGMLLRSGLLKTTQIGVQFRSSLIADVLIALQLKHNPAFFGTRIELIRKDAKRFGSIIRLLSNWSVGDFLDPYSMEGDLLIATNDSELLLTCLIERPLPRICDLSFLAKHFEVLIKNDSDIGNGLHLRSKLLRVLLADGEIDVVDALVTVIVQCESSWIEGDFDAIMDRFWNEENSAIQSSLWKLVRTVAPLDSLEWIKLFIDQGLFENYRGYVAEIFENLDWSRGYPGDLPDMVFMLQDEEITDLLIEYLATNLHPPSYSRSQLMYIVRNGAIGEKTLRRIESILDMYEQVPKTTDQPLSEADDSDERAKEYIGTEVLTSISAKPIEPKKG